MQEYVFKLRDLAEGTTEAEIAAWHVAVGERVQEDQPLVDVMTEKAVIEVPSPVSGVMESMHAAVGERVPVGSTLAVLRLHDPEVEAQSAPPAMRMAAPDALLSGSLAAVATVHEAGVASPDGAVADTPPAIARSKASPSVRRHAQEAGVPLKQIRGSGPAGRVLHQDIDVALGQARASSSTVSETKADIFKECAPRPTAAVPTEEIRIVGLRRLIAERMTASKRGIPHFTYVEEVDMTELEALRLQLNAQPADANRLTHPSRLTPLPFFIRGLARILPWYPDINATYDGEAGVLKRYAAIHVGIATQTLTGLMVPVIRDVQTRTLGSCADELARVTASARAGKATREELSGSTITLTSLGPLGGIAATPIINAPEVAILGPNRIIDRPVAHAGRIIIRKMMNLSASFDHRIVDGYVAAQFIQRLKALLEQPALLFIDPRGVS